MSISPFHLPPLLMTSGLGQPHSKHTLCPAPKPPLLSIPLQSQRALHVFESGGRKHDWGIT